MREIAVHAGFLRDFRSLEPEMRQQIAFALTRFRMDELPGSHVENIHRPANARFRSVRVTKSMRAIVLAPITGNTHVLLKVLPQDDAYQWAERTTLTVTSTRKLNLIDRSALDELTQRTRRATPGPYLLSTFSDGQLRSLGICDEVIPLARNLRTEAQLDAARGVIPARQWDIIQALASGLTVDEIAAELNITRTESVSAGPTLELDAIDEALLDDAIANTPEDIYLVTSDNDFERILDRPFATWRIYLDPAQRKLVNAVYSGPARITGGPGTGKSIVCMHRAKVLAERGEGRVLLATYNSSLAKEIARGLDELITDAHVRQRVTVLTINAVARRILKPSAYPIGPSRNNGEVGPSGRSDSLISSSKITSLWNELRRKYDIEESASFLNDEWNLVVLPQQIKNQDDYLSALRIGRGRALNNARRKQVWTALDEFRHRLWDNQWWTFETEVHFAAQFAANSREVPYRHIIVDESQDFSRDHWRLVEALMARDRADNLFISGDTGQQIYSHGESMRSVGINIVGRSRRLTLNHRSSAEILSFGNRILGDTAPTDDRGMRAVFHRDPPTLIGWPTREDEIAYVVDTVWRWHHESKSPLSNIAVATRKVKMIPAIREALADQGIPCRALSRYEHGGDRRGVTIGTMHSLKGLEFQRVIVTGVSADAIPPPGSITPAGEDQLTHEAELTRERHLLYVACTRARDSLVVTWVGEPSRLLPRP